MGCVQAMYKNAGAAGGAAGAASGSSEEPEGKEKVVDADFEEKSKK